MTRRRLLAVAAVALLCAGGVSLILTQRSTQAPAERPALYVGRAGCARCHADVADRYSGSDHDLAMQEVSAATVLGNFSGATFSKDGEQFTFTRREARYWVQVRRGDDEAAEYPVRYVFGHRPLQQYLLEVGAGRLQALTVCWDTRPAEDGGQRWFSLYPDEETPPGDALHWLSPQYNWNHMCAQCHSTAIRKNYRATEDRFDTTYEEIDVSCEECHGPGSDHVIWAEEGQGVARADKGLRIDLGSARLSWSFAGGPTATAKTPRSDRVQVEACGRCHSRRHAVREESPREQLLAQTHRVALLEEHLYYADGQIKDEVYVYGSFIQSKMYRSGVTCSDCHDPHSAGLLVEGNALCARCHAAATFDTPEHHHHLTDSAGSACVDCHMPARNYMVVDPRRDHGFRVPRPDLSKKLGIPNPCSGCHGDRTSTWAAQIVAEWYGDSVRSRPQFAAALQAGRVRSAGSEALLVAVAVDVENPGIVRATALSLLPRPLAASALTAVERAASDTDPLVRRTVAEMLVVLPPDMAARLGATLLEDPVLTVRLAAVVALGRTAQQLAPGQFDRVLREARSALSLHLDRADSCYNAANLETNLGNLREAERLLRRSLDLDTNFVPARVNLADVLRAQGRNTESLAQLRTALENQPENAEVHHALGLALIRERQPEAALEHLREAAVRRPETPRFALVYAVALHDLGQSALAMETLTDAAERHPLALDVNLTLVHYLEEAGRTVDAKSWEQRLRTTLAQDQE